MYSNHITNNSLSDLTILINSCDLYRDAWEPFIKLFYIQWNDCPYPIAINSETCIYKGEYSEKVQTIISDRKKLTWSKRFRSCLEKIDTEVVLFILEDYFVQNKVSVDVFEHAHKLMKQNKKIGMAALSYGASNVEDGKFEDKYFYSRIINEKNKIWCRINLYRRDYLLNLLRDHENIWEFEQYASYRAKKLPYFIIQQKDSVPECFTFYVKYEEGYGISGRKWLPKNKELFEKYVIEVNFENLGFLDFEDCNKSPQEKGAKEKQKGIKENLYLVKKGVLCLPKKVKKKISKLKSII